MVMDFEVQKFEMELDSFQSIEMVVVVVVVVVDIW